MTEKTSWQRETHQFTIIQRANNTIEGCKSPCGSLHPSFLPPFCENRYQNAADLTERWQEDKSRVMMLCPTMLLIMAKGWDRQVVRMRPVPVWRISQCKQSAGQNLSRGGCASQARPGAAALEGARRSSGPAKGSEEADSRDA